MSIFSKVAHHVHIRKRLHENLEKYPHPDKFKNFLDKFIFFIGLMGPVMTIPQVWQIYSTQDATGVSLISWSWYLFSAFVWLAYGIIHKEKAIVFAQSLWIVTEIILITGIIIY